MGLRLTACVTACALGCASLATSAAAAKSTRLGPVPARVFTVVNRGGPFYTLRVGHLRKPRISAAQAVRRAVHDWSPVGPPNGVSLVRTTKESDPQHPGQPVWLVSFHVIHGTPSHGPGPHRHRSNYLVVAIDPYTGAFVQADGGYDPKLTRR